MTSDSLTQTLQWITELLRGAGIRHQFVGGLAARVYGTRRELADIDLYVPDQDLARVARIAGEFLVQGPVRHVDRHWDLTFLKIDYLGWRIEIAGADTARVWDGLDREWRSAAIDFGASEVRRFRGIAVPVMPLKQLVGYKRGLGRPVDVQDLAELEKPSRGVILRDAVITFVAVAIAVLALDDITTDKASSFTFERTALAGCAVWFVAVGWRLVKRGSRIAGTLSLVLVTVGAVAQPAIGPDTLPGLRIEYLATVGSLLWFAGLAVFLTALARREGGRIGKDLVP